MSEIQNQTKTSPEDVLFTDADLLQQYIPATNTQRFLNFLIDRIFMRIALEYVAGLVLYRILSLLSADFIYNIFDEGSFWELVLLNYLLSFMTFTLYYTICEKAFRGQTLGKLVTGTRAIREDGQELTLKDAFLRSISRLVPFESLSIWFGNGMWHDTWTKTAVVKSR